MNKDSLIAGYRTDGYVLIKNVFKNHEIEDFRERIRRADKAPEKTEILSYPELRPILLDDRILALARMLLGSRLIYFGDSTFRCEYADGARGFHQDSKSDDADPSSTEYPLARIGLYLQDHARHGGGLKVRRGSHKHVYIGRKNIRRLFSGLLKPASFGLGPGVNIPIEAGDLVAWNLRTWHSGYAVRLKSFPNFCLNPRIEKYIPKSLSLPARSPRMVIFASFGAPSEYFENYMAERANVTGYKEHWDHARFDDPEIAKACASKKIELRFDALHRS